MLTCERSQIHNFNTKQVMLEHLNTDVIQEGVFIESGKVLISDLVKNLLSTGAVALTGGMGGDTAVDLMFAIERTKKVVDAYNAIQEAGKGLSVFLKKIDDYSLDGNLDTITDATEEAVAMLASKIDRIGEKGTAAKKSAELTEFTEDLVDDFMAFFKKTAKSLSTWISAIIPDDGGNIGTFINVTLVGIAEAASERPLDAFLSVVEQLPSEFKGLVFDEQELASFLIETCNKIADAVEEYGGGTLGDTAKSGMSMAQSYYDFLGDTPVGYVYDAGGAIGKKAGELIGGKDSALAKAGEAAFDPRKKVKMGTEALDSLITEFPKYIRSELIPEIPEAVATYAKFMKYVVSFLHLLELVTTGKLEKVASAENYEQEEKMIAEIRRSLIRHQRMLVR